MTMSSRADGFDPGVPAPAFRPVEDLRFHVVKEATPLKVDKAAANAAAAEAVRGLDGSDSGHYVKWSDVKAKEAKARARAEVDAKAEADVKLEAAFRDTEAEAINREWAVKGFPHRGEEFGEPAPMMVPDGSWRDVEVPARFPDVFERQAQDARYTREAEREAARYARYAQEAGFERQNKLAKLDDKLAKLDAAFAAGKAPVQPVSPYNFEFSDAVDKVMTEAAELLERKHLDYGPKNIGAAPGGPLNGLRVRMHDKLARLNHLVDTGVEPANETLRDTLIDMLNYSAIALMVVDGSWPE